jgi:small-conductance mechanosensitive channel
MVAPVRRSTASESVRDSPARLRQNPGLTVKQALILVLACASLALPSTARAQDPTAPPPARQEPEAVLTRETLQSLAVSIDQKRGEVEAARAALAAATGENDRVDSARALAALQAELLKLEQSFASLALGADVSALLMEEEQALDLAAELQRLLEPLIQELKDATEEPRQISALKSQIDLYEAHAATIRRGILRLDGLIERSEPESPLRLELQRSRDEWARNATDQQRRAQVARAQLEQRLAARTSLIDSTSQFLRRFFGSQGFTLLLGLGTFIGVLFGMRLLYRPLQKALRRRRREERPFYTRLLAAVFYLGSTLLAIIATLLVFWAAGDWVLLGLALIFLFGLAWASRQTLPRYVEQVKLFLNLGSVREGERLVIDGIAYRVDSLNLFSRLVNEELSGGTLRVPIQELGGMRSRPLGPREPWFPSSEGDWVLLADGTRGKVLSQTPEFVQLVMLGGARLTMPTADYLSAAPRNLSKGFRILSTFGIDYAHQAICTTEVPGRMREAVEAALNAAFGAEQVVNVSVDFKEAAASSLDFVVVADLTGTVAPRYGAVPCVIQRALVDLCNERGWVIPFQQLTVHQASG